MRTVTKRLLVALVLTAVLGAASAGYHATRLHHIRRCVEACRELWKSGEQPVREDSYVPAGIPTGASEPEGSFFLQDTRNKVWVFTPALIGITADAARSRSRFTRLCGFKAAFVEKLSLPLNNRVYDGFIEEYVPARSRIQGREQFALLGEAEAADVLSALLVFEYLFGRESGLVWVFDSDGNLTATRGSGYLLREKVSPADAEVLCPDLVRRIDAAALTALNNSPHAAENVLIPASQEQWSAVFSPATLDILAAAARRNIRPDLELLSKTAHFIREMPESLFLDIFRIGGLTRTREYAAYTQGLLARKRMMTRFVRVFLRQASQMYQEPFTPALKKRYTIREFKDIIAALGREKDAASGIAAKPKDARQRMLVIPESPEARFVARSYRDCALAHQEALSALVRLRAIAMHPREKESVDFFIKEIVTGHVSPHQPCTERIPAAN